MSSIAILLLKRRRAHQNCDKFFYLVKYIYIRGIQGCASTIVVAGFRAVVIEWHSERNTLRASCLLDASTYKINE